jgi:hypothetical protein
LSYRRRRFVVGIPILGVLIPGACICLRPVLRRCVFGTLRRLRVALGVVALCIVARGVRLFLSARFNRATRFSIWFFFFRRVWGLGATKNFDLPYGRLLI